MKKPALILINAGFLLFWCMVLILLYLFLTNYTLTITVTGIEKAKGQLVLAVYNSAETFLDGHKLYAYRFIEVKEVGELFFELELPDGEYAISLYHDINADKELNKNFLIGVPLEPYGFSNNARRFFRAPEYSEAKIVMKEDMRISIHIH